MVRSVAVLAWLLACASAMVPPPRAARGGAHPAARGERLPGIAQEPAPRDHRRRRRARGEPAPGRRAVRGLLGPRDAHLAGTARAGSGAAARLDEDEAAAALEALHERAAEDILAAILHMRGAYVKIGQVLSSRPDVIPRAWVEKLSALQDDVPGRGGAVARRAIRRELGAAKAAGLTAGFVDAQIGAAATGQPEWSPVMAEISRRFLSEFDFRNEADALGEVRANLRSRPRVDDVDVEVPEPLPELSSRKIVTMAYLPDGVKLAEWGKKRFGAIPWYNPWAKVALRGGSGARCALLAYHGQEILLDGVFNGDPHPGNLLLVVARRGRRGRVVDVFTRAGFATRDMREDLIFEWANLWFNVDYEGPLNPQFHLEQLNKADPVKAVPEDWIMASRVRFLLGGLAKHLDMSFKVADIWRPYAEEALRAK
ncbi:ABC1 family-like protein [Aureococcus anophagefferens]|nr:ABC1 family-like protein [Aureococcus anophagefferens]